ncbi:MAG: trypsin-like peptidase domain-containing protein [Flavobacteriales bacterium]|jgi:Do/DeqQ family serine protease
MKKLLGSFVMACVGGAVAFALFHFTQEEAPAPQQQVIYDNTPVRYTLYSGDDTGMDFTAAAEMSVNSVVHVKTETTVQSQFNHPWFDYFGLDSSPQIQRGSGSGVIISNDGYLITNYHVIEGAQKIVVSLNNNTTYDGTIVGTDPATDLAVLKIEANNLPSLRFGNSDAVRIGEWVLAVGNPFDLTSTVTAGIVSAKARNINLLRGDSSREIFPIESFIQTDAAVNPGNSGGALVNTRGELIGINTAIASRTGSYAGYSFAVPSSIVSKVAADLMEFGIVQRAFIGVRIQEVTQDIAKENGLSKIEGVYVNGLTEAGAAAEAGIEEGDIILRIGTNVVKTVPELQEQISRYRPGDRVDVAVWRDKKERIVPVVLRNQNGNTELRDAAIENARSALGAQLKEVDPKLLGELGISGGAQVTSLGSGKLAEAGIQPNFIITRIDGKPVNSPDEVLKTLQAKSGGVLVEGIYPNGRKAYYGFGM